MERSSVDVSVESAKLAGSENYLSTYISLALYWVYGRNHTYC